MGRVQGKIALVTGANGGIGRATCALLAREGATVFGLDIRKPKAHEEQDPKLGITLLQSDVSAESDVEAAVKMVVDSAGRLDVLVNNAGITGPSGPSHLLAREDFDRLFAVNALGTWLFTKHAVSAMLGSGGGSIVNMSSMNGIIGGSSIPLYHATKAATRLMAKSDAVTYARRGIRVNSIHPGLIETAMTDDLMGRSGAESEEHYRRYIESVPLGKRGEPDDIAYGVLYLASDESKYLTGAELVIDGGYTAK